MVTTRSAMSFVFSVIAVLALLLGSNMAQALTIKLSLSEMTDMADTIVVGTVVSSQSRWDAAHNNINSEVVVSVTDSLKGKADKKTITIIVPGGTVGDIAQWVEDAPSFEAGEDVGLFIEDLDSAKVFQMGLGQAFQLAADGSIGRIIGGFQGKRSLAKDGQSLSRRISADKFKNDVRMALDGQAVPEVENQLLLERETFNLYDISTISPISASAGTGTLVTVTGSGFGTPGEGWNGLAFFEYEFWGSGGTADALIGSPYVSWSDTQIKAYVPVYKDINGKWHSSSSGPVRVDKGGTFGPPIDFNVSFGYGQCSWPGDSPNIIYKVNDSGVAGRLAAIQAAMASWNNAGARFTLSYGGTHTQTDYVQNGVNEIFWTPNISKGTYAINRTIYYISSGDIIESDIGFNTAYTWSYAAACPPQQCDIQSVATHEMGHSLHLLDLYGNKPGYTQDTDKMMYGLGEPGEMKRALPDYDKLGIQWIYGSTQLLAASFAGSGHWVYNPNTATWAKITPDTPENIIYIGTTLYGDFGALGLWKWDGTEWTQLSPANPENMVTWGAWLYGDFGALGLWKWDGTAWTRLTASNPENMVAYGSTLYGDFGALGLWKWDGTAWTRLTASNPENMVAYGSTLYGDFGALGLWKWDGIAWTQLTWVNPENMVVAGTALYVDFGAVGLWKWNGSSWTQLTASNPENMVTSGAWLYGDFGALGLWKWDATAWTRLTGDNPENIIYSVSTLYGDFGAIGLWKWNALAWTQLTGSNPVIMAISN